MRWHHVGLALLLLSLVAVLCAPYARPAPGDFYGTTLAWVEVRYPNVVTLLWTNPPDLDLAEIRMFAQKVGETDSIALPPFRGRKVNGVEGEPYELHPGLPESLWVALPCRTSFLDWRFWIFAVDTAGNVSGRSNIATWRQNP